MPQDFAKNKKDTGSSKRVVEKTQARRSAGKSQPGSHGFRLYFAGVMTGVFLSGLGYLATMTIPADPAAEADGAPPAAEVPKPRFDFYTKLPTQTLEEKEEPEAVEPAAVVSKPPTPSTAPQSLFLQAGSFRQQADAERRRAELVLLGLTPKLEETNNDSGHWFRVYIGPFDSHDAMTRARGLMAAQNIDTLLLKRSGP